MLTMSSQNQSSAASPSPSGNTNTNSNTPILFDDNVSISDFGSLSDLLHDQQDFNDDFIGDVSGHLTPVNETSESVFSPAEIPSFDAQDDSIGTINTNHLDSAQRNMGININQSNTSNRLAASAGEALGAAGEEESYTPSYFPSAVPVLQPNENDVLLGRGGRNNQWNGNENLRLMARSMAFAYAQASKRNKPSIAANLVNQVRALNPPGRFLKQEQAVGVWHDVEEEVAREKASQCLRDIVAAITKGKVKTGKVKTDGEMGNNSFASFDGMASMEGDLTHSASASRLAPVGGSSHMFGNNNVQAKSNIDVSKFFGHSKSAANLAPVGSSNISNPAAAAGLALMRGSATMANLGGVGSSIGSNSGNAQWNTNPMMMNNSNTNNMFMMNQATSQIPMGQSAAARAGLSMLRAGGPPQTRVTAAMNNANFAMSRIVSNTSTGAVNRMGSNNPAAQAGLAMLMGNRGDGLHSVQQHRQQQQPQQLPNIREGNTSTSMQISSVDLRDMAAANNMNRNGMNGNGVYVNPQRQIRFGGSAVNIVVDPNAVIGESDHSFTPFGDEGVQGGGDDTSFAALERKRRFVSAPNLGDISSFLAKRQRGVSGFPPVASSQNDTFASPDEFGSLEPIQLEEFQRPRNRATKAVSCMTLGGGLKSASAINLGSSRRRRESGYQDPLLRRLQMLKSGGGEGESSMNFSDHNTSLLEEDESQSSMGNFAWNSSTAQNRPNMFANITQRNLTGSQAPPPHPPTSSIGAPPEVPTEPEHNCFTGMGAVFGEGDDAALQRWIDRMAEEELS